MPSQIVRHHFWQSQNRLPELVRLFSQGGLTTSLNLFFCPLINFYPWPSSEQDVWTPWPADEAKCNEGVGLGDNYHWFAYPSSGFTDILRAPLGKNTLHSHWLLGVSNPWPLKLEGELCRKVLKTSSLFIGHLEDQYKCWKYHPIFQAPHLSILPFPSPHLYHSFMRPLHICIHQPTHSRLDWNGSMSLP